MIEDWLEPIPHLPNTWRKLISNNIWWLVALGVVGSVIGILSSLNIMFHVTSLLPIDSYSNYHIYGGYNRWWMMVLTISLLFSITTTAITATAISPLKNLKRKGWDLLFLAYIIGIIGQVVIILINFNVFSFIPSVIFSAISVAIGAYLLFEIRSHFNAFAILSKKK